MSATATTAVEATHGLSLEWNTADPVEVRRRIRTGRYHGHTGALAKGYVQANLAILPSDYADEFARFCQRNPKPCPLLAMSEPGSPHLPEIAEDLDLRTDLPSYRVFRDGELDGDVRSIGDLWARRLRGVRARVLVLVRGGPDRCRTPDPALEGRQHVPDVPDRHRVRAGRPVPQQNGGVDAAVHSGRRHQGGADHEPVSSGARCAGPSRHGRNASGSGTSIAPGRATIPSSPPTRCRSSGPAA